MLAEFISTRKLFSMVDAAGNFLIIGKISAKWILQFLGMGNLIGEENQ